MRPPFTVPITIFYPGNEESVSLLIRTPYLAPRYAKISGKLIASRVWVSNELGRTELPPESYITYVGGWGQNPMGEHSHS